MDLWIECELARLKAYLKEALRNSHGGHLLTKTRVWSSRGCGAGVLVDGEVGVVVGAGVRLAWLVSW